MQRERAIDWTTVLRDAQGHPRYEVIAVAFERAIADGRLRPGARLPTVRELARELGMSGATVAAAYELLNRRGWTRGEVGRGTFVVGPVAPTQPTAIWPPRSSGSFGLDSARSTRSWPWRQRALIASATRLLRAYPDAVDCSTGRPDPELLPLDVLQRSWSQAISGLEPADLQYTGPEPAEPLSRALLPRLRAEGVPARAEDLLVGGSALELIVLTLHAAATGSTRMLVAVEEPGYARAFDAIELAGHRLVGFDVDAQGAVPASLQAALSSGATAVLLTPRVHNPTGASWTPGRRAELADVLAAFPGVVVIEDDHFGELSRSPSGSLLAHPRLEERVVYVRSFAKALGPDLRVAIAVARPKLRAPLAEAKSLTAGWTSRLSQLVLANMLGDAELDAVLRKAQRLYTARRAAANSALTARLRPAGGEVAGDDGLNLWLRLPFGAVATDVIESAGRRGILVASGQPYFVRPGQRDLLRLTIAPLSAESARDVGAVLAEVATTIEGAPPSAMLV